MIEQDYVDFSNFAFDLRRRAEAFFAEMDDEHINQLGGFVRNEIAASPGGVVEPAYDFLAAILAEEVAERANPSKNVVQMPKRCADDLPF